MRRHRLELKDPHAYVIAVSGVFINPKYPTGLTAKEISVISAMITVMHKMEINVITRGMRIELMKRLKLTQRNFYNTIWILKNKNAITADDMLNPIFRVPVSLTVEFPEDDQKQEEY